MNALVWSVEWRRALTDKRDLGLRVVLPLAIVLVISTGALPLGAAAGAYVALFVGFGMFQPASALLRDAESGLAVRVMRGGVSSASYLLQRSAAAAVLDIVCLLPALAVAVVSMGASVVESLIALSALVGSVWIASLLGAFVAALSRSAGEALVLCVVALVLLLHMSGVFTTPSPGGLGAFLEAASPFCALHESFLSIGATGGGVAVGGGYTLAAWSLLLPVLTGLLAPCATGCLKAKARPART